MSYTSHDYQRMHQEKKRTLQQCLDLIESGDHICFGQVCSESIGTKQYSGPGGGFDFAYGAARSRGGRSILIMHSTTNKGQSKIKPPDFRGELRKEAEKLFYICV